MSILWSVAILYALTLLAYEVWRTPRLRAVVLQEKCERNRNNFGELRTELMRLARESEIDVKSDGFAVLYRSLTMLMRAPSEYPNAVRLLLWFSNPQEKTQIRLTPREGKLLIDYAGRLDILCRDFDVAYRFIARRLERRHDGTPLSQVPPLLHFWLIRGRRERASEIEMVQKVKTNLREYGQRALAAA